jgi:hypothetical protein
VFIELISEKGFRGLLLSRARVRLYWPVLAWAVLLLLISLGSPDESRIV